MKNELTIQLTHPIETKEMPFINRCINRARNLQLVFGGISLHFHAGYLSDHGYRAGKYAEFRWRSRTIAVLSMGSVPKNVFSRHELAELDPSQKIWMLDPEHLVGFINVAVWYEPVSWGDWREDWKRIFKKGMELAAEALEDEVSVLKKQIESIS